MRLSAYYPEIFRAVRDFLVHKSRRMYVVRQDPDDPQKVRLAYKRGGPEDGFPYPVMTHPTSTIVGRPGGPKTGAGVVVEDKHGDGNWAVWAAIPAENNDTGDGAFIPGERIGIGALNSMKSEHYPPVGGNNIDIGMNPPVDLVTAKLQDGAGLAAVPLRYALAYRSAADGVTYTAPGPVTVIIPTSTQGQVKLTWDSGFPLPSDMDRLGVLRSKDGAPFQLIYEDTDETGELIDNDVSGSAYDPEGFLFSSTGIDCPLILPCEPPDATGGAAQEAGVLTLGFPDIVDVPWPDSYQRILLSDPYNTSINPNDYLERNPWLLIAVDSSKTDPHQFDPIRIVDQGSTPVGASIFSVNIEPNGTNADVQINSTYGGAADAAEAHLYANGSAMFGGSMRAGWWDGEHNGDGSDHWFAGKKFHATADDLNLIGYNGFLTGGHELTLATAASGVINAKYDTRLWDIWIDSTGTTLGRSGEGAVKFFDITIPGLNVASLVAISSAGTSYTAVEQGMINAMWDIMDALGLIIQS